MADTPVKNSSNRRLSSRLQLRAPASIKISPVTDWNVAIPLLSPLDGSPTSPTYRTAEIKPKKEESRRDNNNSRQIKEQEKAAPVVYKKWQHPAAPFCYDSPPMRPFLLTAVSDRS